MNWTSLALAFAAGQVGVPDNERLDRPPVVAPADGTWSVAYMEANGQPVALRNNSVVTIRGNVLTFLAPGGQDVSLRLNFGPGHVLTTSRLDPDRTTGRPVAPAPLPVPAPAPVPNPGRGSNPANPDGTRGGLPLGGSGGSGVGGTGTGSADRGGVGSASPPLGGVGTRADAVRTGGDTGVYVLTRDYLVLDFGGTVGSVPLRGNAPRGTLDQRDYGTPQRNDAERVGDTGRESPGGPRPSPERGSPGPVGTGGLGTGDTTPRGVGGGTAPGRRDRETGAIDAGPSEVSRAFVMILRRGTGSPTSGVDAPPTTPDPRLVPRAPPRP